jgi:uncharacterized glyoxalase superfamily protein PhnB
MTEHKPPKTVWPTLVYSDAKAAIRFLVEAFGFTESLVVEGEGDGVVDHAQLLWPEGGGIMLGSAGRDEVFTQRPTGSGSTYVVTDEPDKLHARAAEAGAELVRDLQDEEYGSRGFSVRDPEANIWSFGTYRGE